MVRTAGWGKGRGSGMPGCCMLSLVLWKLVNACDMNSHHSTKHVSQADAIPQYSDINILQLQHILVWRAYVGSHVCLCEQIHYILHTVYCNGLCWMLHSISYRLWFCCKCSSRNHWYMLMCRCSVSTWVVTGGKPIPVFFTSIDTNNSFLMGVAVFYFKLVHLYRCQNVTISYCLIICAGIWAMLYSTYQDYWHYVCWCSTHVVGCG